MAYFETIAWDNPWLAPVQTGTGGLGNNTTYITASMGSPVDWNIGVIATEITLYLTLYDAATVNVTIYNDSFDAIGGDVFVLGSGAQVLSCPIVAQTGNLAQITLEIPDGNFSTPDILTDVVVSAGPVITPEFWTSFTKSYEIP